VVSCLLLIVLFRRAELFFQSPLLLIARKICETSEVNGVMADASLVFLRLPMFYLLCITTIIIIIKVRKL